MNSEIANCKLKISNCKLKLRRVAAGGLRPRSHAPRGNASLGRSAGRVCSDTYLDAADSARRAARACVPTRSVGTRGTRGFAILVAFVIFTFGSPGYGFPPPNVSVEGSEAGTTVAPIDLPSALKLAGLENPGILISRQRVVEALAQRQLAAAQFLPSLNAGLNYDAHTGPLQQSTGNILKIDRDSLYLGSGAYAVSGGTVNVPGLVYDLNVSQTIYNYLSARQQVNARRFADQAMENEMLRRVASAYLELLRREGLRGLTLKAQTEAATVSNLTNDWAKVRQGRQADADRAATELDDRQIDHIEAESKVDIASARLAELLNLPPVPRLHPTEERLVPLPVVPDPLPLPELLAIALTQRPELAQRQAIIRQAFLELSAAKVLPFSPNFILGLSGGVFGGGSNNAPSLPRFGSFDNRNDLDVVLYWTVQNLGVGNAALIRIAASHTRMANLEQVEVLNRVRSEVAQAHVRTQIYYARMLASEQGAASGEKAFAKDMERIRGGVGLPIELLASYRLLNQARADYLDAIVGYNQAQLDLYAALGQPPADILARPVPFRGKP